MKKRQEIEQREQSLWVDEGEIAIRITQWFDVLVKMRRAADTVPADQLMAVIRQADPEQLAVDHLWLMMMLTDRFKGERDTIGRRRQSIESIEQRWATQANKVKLEAMLRKAENLKALGHDREHIIDVVAGVDAPKKKRQKVKRILSDNKALPLARKRRAS